MKRRFGALLVLTAVYVGLLRVQSDSDRAKRKWPNDFFKGLKTKNEDVLILYTENEDINMLLHSKGKEADLNKMYDSIFKNFSYKILSTEKNEEENPGYGYS